MSKRHRKSKEMFAAFSGSYEDMLSNDSDMFVAPRGKKPKGKQRRKLLKPAYYDE